MRISRRSGLRLRTIGRNGVSYVSTIGYRLPRMGITARKVERARRKGEEKKQQQHLLNLASASKANTRSGSASCEPLERATRLETRRERRSSQLHFQTSARYSVDGDTLRRARPSIPSHFAPISRGSGERRYILTEGYIFNGFV